MKTFYVFTDSTADVEKTYRDEYDFGYLKMAFKIEDKDYPADLEWQEINSNQFYNFMRQGNRVTTNQVLTLEVETKFEEAFKKGLDVLYIACSNKLSTSVNYAKTIGEELKEKYPERKIVCFDSLRSNYAEGLMAIQAAKMANEGKTIEETVAYLEENKLNYQTFATVGSLNWLRMAGRVKASTAFFGNLFGVKPIICSDMKGNNYGFKKVKGRKTSLDELVEQVSSRLVNNSEATVYVEHADCIKDAEYVANNIKSKTNCKEVHISLLGPIIGASCGPDTITVNFYGKKMDIVGEE